MSPEPKLTQLNVAIGEAEKQRDKDTLDQILANDLIFRRVSGVVVDKATYLEELLKPENTYNHLCSEVVDVNLSKSQNAAIFTLHVCAKGKRGENPFEGVFRNIRFFKKGEQDWQCHMWFNEPLESLSINDAYTLYEEGKKRRYGLLFAVNGGAFAIYKLLAISKDQLLPSSQYQVLGGLSLAHLAILMGIFTLLIVWDILDLAGKCDRHLKREVFGSEGKAILFLLGLLIVLGWFLVLPDTPISKSNQIIAFLFPVGFLAVFRWLSHWNRDRPSRSLRK